MRNKLKILLGFFLSFFILNCYAIKVNVQSSSSGVGALGFTVNGKNHGGMGRTYSANGMPVGTYTFGIRAGGALTGTDVGCATSSGKKTVTLNKDSTAVLKYDGKRCTMSIF